MKKKFQGWRKKVAVGLLAATLCGSLSAQTAMATMHYDRDRQLRRNSSNRQQILTVHLRQLQAKRPGRRSTANATMEAEKSFQGPSPEESMCPNGRKPSTGRK